MADDNGGNMWLQLATSVVDTVGKVVTKPQQQQGYYPVYTNQQQTSTGGTGLLGGLGSVGVGVAPATINKIFGWIAGIVVGTVLLIFVMKKKK